MRMRPASFGWFLLALGCMLLMGPMLARATDYYDEPDPPQPEPINTANASSTSTSTATTGASTSSAEAAGGAASASNQLDQVINQSLISITQAPDSQDVAPASVTPQAGGDTTGDILSPTTNVNVVTENPDDIKIRNVPSMVAPDIFPTTSCFKGASGALSVTGFGISGGAGSIDQGCVEREEIRLAHAMGMTQRALWRWCNLPNNVESFGSAEACMTFDPVGDQLAANFNHVASTFGYVTQPELDAADEAIMQEVEVQVAQVEDTVQRIEERLERQAAAAQRAAEEDRQWRQTIAEKYLPQD